MFSTVIHDPNNKDLEDGLQIQCAEKEHVDYLVTENLKDFFGSRVKVLSAGEASCPAVFKDSMPLGLLRVQSIWFHHGLL